MIGPPGGLTAPVNANGIGEMGYDKGEMERQRPGSYARARQILADLDAVGNTTKAETKGTTLADAGDLEETISAPMNWR